MWAVYILERKILFSHELSCTAQWIRLTFVSMSLRPWYSRGWEGGGGKRNLEINLRSLLVNASTFVWGARKGFNPPLDLWMRLRGSEVLRWWGRELHYAPSVCPWDSEQMLSALCSFLADFLPWIITHVKPRYLGYLEGAKQERRM